MIKVKSTTDYSRFKFMLGNRPIDKRIKKMIRAIKRKNMLADFPILITSNGDGRYLICDGQTRFEAAKQLKLPVFFIESDHIKIEDMQDANSTQTPWSARDYIHSWSKRGNKHYSTLSTFVQEFGLPITISAKLLFGQSPGGQNMTPKLRSGTFVVHCENLARKVAGFIIALKGYIPFANEECIALALAYVMQVKEFDPSRFLQKIKGQQTRFVKCATTDQYLALIEDIYNYRVRSNQITSLVLEVRKLRSAK